MDAVNSLNRAYTYEFVEHMNALKPDNPRDPNYAEKYRAWQKAYAFTAALRDRINDLNNKYVLKGKVNTSL